MIKIMNGKPVIVDEDGKTRVLFDNLPGDIGGTPGYNELLEDVQNLMDYVYSTDVYTENKTPYFFRASGGGVDVGVCENDMLVGGSVGWNQLTRPLEATYWNAQFASVTFDNNTVTATATATDTFGIYLKLSYRFSIVGHKYLMSGDVTASTSGDIRLSFNDKISDNTVTANTKTRIAKILNEGTANQAVTVYKVSNITAGDTLTAENIMCIDLTLLLGSTIADRLYTLEQSTAGSGIAQLKAWGFDFDEYIPYTVPTLKHVEGVSAHVMRDANDNIIGNYPLDATLTLRGVPKLDANNQLYFDGDIYEPDGAVTRNFAVRAYQSGDESLADAITDGTNTVYKLSTPTTETAEPYTQYQEVDASGTEEYVSTGVVPVGHETKYPTDLKGKLEQILEGVPTTDGTYVLTATVSSGKATYSWESTSSAKTTVKEPIDTLEKEVAEKPSEEEPEEIEEPVDEEEPEEIEE